MLFGLGEQVAAPGKVGNDHRILLPYHFGRHVLVTLGRAAHGGHMHAAFVREGALAHIGLMVVGRAVGDFIHKARKVGEFRQVTFRQARIAHLEFQVGDD